MNYIPYIIAVVVTLLLVYWLRERFVLFRLRKLQCPECGDSLTASKYEQWGQHTNQGIQSGCIMTCANCRLQFRVTDSGKIFDSEPLPGCPNCGADSNEIETTNAVQSHCESDDGKAFDEWVFHGRCKACNSALTRRSLVALDDDSIEADKAPWTIA